MTKFVPWNAIILSVIFPITGTKVLADAAAIYCVENTVSENQGTGVLNLVPSDARRTVEAIKSSMSISRAIGVVGCTLIDRNTLAIVPDPDKVGGDFIVIDGPSLGQVLRSDFPEEANFIVAHEMAHILNDDFGPGRADVSRRKKEDEADKFAVCAVARLSGSWSSLALFLRNLRDLQSEDYSLFADVEDNLKNEFNKCYVERRGETIAGPPIGVGPSIFYLDLNTEELRGHAASVSFSPSGDVLAVVMEIRDERIVRFFETKTWQTIAAAPIELGNIFASRFSPDGRFLVLAGFLDGAAIYDREKNWTRTTINPKRGDVKDFAFLPDENSTIVTASDDGNACIVNITNPQSLRCFEHRDEAGKPIELFSVAVSPDGTEIATGTYRSINRWAVQNNRTPIATIETRDLAVDLEYSMSGEILYAAIEDEGLFGFPIGDGRRKVIFSEGMSAYDTFIQLNSTGDRLLASMGGYNNVQITAFSTRFANPVFSITEDDYFRDSNDKYVDRVRRIYDYEISRDNKYLAIVGHAVMVFELLQ